MTFQAIDISAKFIVIVRFKQKLIRTMIFYEKSIMIYNAVFSIIFTTFILINDLLNLMN